MKKTKNIGLNFPPPNRVCNDRNCPYHGHLKIRGILLEGTLISKKMEKAGVMLREYLYYNKKYQRYEKRHSKITVYIPPCIDVNEGDIIIAAETRPISKSISFVVVYNKSNPPKKVMG